MQFQKILHKDNAIKCKFIYFLTYPAAIMAIKNKFNHTIWVKQTDSEYLKTRVANIPKQYYVIVILQKLL